MYQFENGFGRFEGMYMTLHHQCIVTLFRVVAEVLINFLRKNVHEKNVSYLFQF